MNVFEPRSLWVKTICLCVVLGAGSVRADTIESALTAYSDGNYTGALEILQRLAENGEAHAQYNLGAMYDTGSGVEEDNETAVRWYAAAAEQGLSSAAFNLGNMYREGHGVDQDHDEAARWYEIAATKGDASAQYNLGAMYENGFGTQRDVDLAVEWYQKAASQGLVHAQYRLGKLYVEGNGVNQDRVVAYTWLNRAAIQGYHPAKVDLSTLEDDMAHLRRYINGSNVNLRSEPTTRANVVTRLNRGQGVLEIAAQGDWIQVNVIGTTPQKGWVHRSLLR
ncbi:MAG: SH3 domain-containing protein [Pseudomonadota bacterium]